MKRELNLYNKYRPKCLADFIGQTAVKELLVQALKKKKNPQAFIFYGSHGIGKTSLARILAKMFNCENFLGEGDVCNKCKNCLLIEEAKTLDICEVDAASNSGVDNMREIIQNSHYVPLDLDKKVYIIDEAHNLSSAAWNSLLKTIEEPPSENIIFLFLTTNINKIPETILSRCQKYSFSRFNREELFALMEGIIDGENKAMDEDAKHLISSLSQGSGRECVTLLESIFLNAADRITVSDVERTFSLSNRRELFDLMNLLAEGDLAGCSALLEDCFRLNKNLLNFFSELLAIFMDLYLYEKTSNFSLLKKATREEAEGFMGRGMNLLEAMGILERCINKYEHSNDKMSWAKILLFNLWEAVSAKGQTAPKETPKPKVEKKKPEEKGEIPPKPEIAEEKRETPKEVPAEPKGRPEAKSPAKPELEKKSAKDFHINLEIPKISKELEDKIIYGLHSSNLNKTASLENFEHFSGFVNSDKPSRELLDIFKKIKPIKDQILTTNRTIVVRFMDELDAFVFNELMRRSEFQEELENFFLKRYEWIGVSNEQLKHYIKISKAKRASELSDDIFEKNEGQNLFNEVVKILEEP